jgi:hypothetical protein
VLERVQDPEARELLSRTVRAAGIQGRGLAYLAGLVRNLTGDSRDSPRPPRGLPYAQVTFIERRALQVTRGLYGDRRLSRMRRPR